MIKEVDEEYLSNYVNACDNPFRKYFVYEEKNTIIGYFVVDLIYERMELVDIFVVENERNRKIGTSMIKYMIDFARTNGFANVTLEVADGNTFAIKLYENFGFVKVANRAGYYGDRDGILMELVL